MGLYSILLSIVFFIYSISSIESKFPESVYYLICTGKYAKSHHRYYTDPAQYCRGLNACKADIIRLDSAQTMAIRPDPCYFCFATYEAYSCRTRSSDFMLFTN